VERRSLLVAALQTAGIPNDPEATLNEFEQRVRALVNTFAAFHEAGRIIGGLGRPTVLVQEGGYDLETLGSLTLEVLRGVESA
jgi:acetoin utilization deacetylase AcuC-like enzyme